MDIDQDSAQVRIPPPVILLTFIVIGAMLHITNSIPIIPEKWRWPLASIFLIIGVGTILYCAWFFKKAKTDIKPWKTTSHLVTTNIYRFSRNPIYLSFVFIGLGVAFAVNSLWIAVLQVPLIVVINKWVIGKEEKYLERKFGDDYRNYKRSVRRWI